MENKVYLKEIESLFLTYICLVHQDIIWELFDIQEVSKDFLVKKEAFASYSEALQV